MSTIRGTAVKEICVADNPGITQFGWKTFLKAVKESSSIERLDLSYNLFGRYGAITGTPLFAMSGLRLVSLNLAHNQLSGSHADRLADEWMRHKTSIKELKVMPGNYLDQQEETTLHKSVQPSD